VSALALDTVPWFRKLAAMPVSSHVTNFKYKYNAGKLQVSKQGKQMMIKTVQLLYLYYCHRSLYEHHQHLQTALNLSLYCQLPTQTHTHTITNLQEEAILMSQTSPFDYLNTSICKIGKLFCRTGRVLARCIYVMLHA